MWASVERGILDAPGPVITTSTKPDNLKATLTARAAIGPVGVFDPQGMLSPGFAHHVAWDAIAGCDDPMRAATRADDLASNTGITDGSENRIWRGHAKTVIETTLHAAALTGASIETAYRWLQSEHALEIPLDTLERHPGACPTWDARLRGIINNPDPRFVGSVMSVVAAAIAPLALPTVRAALTPAPGRPAITAERLLATNGTLYAIATDRGAAAASGLVSALIEDIAYIARHAAARSPGGRMAPPVLFLLDECANVAPIPSLPALLADGRGQNLTVIPIFQALAQVRSRNGTDDAGDLSALIGERDERFATTSRSAHALAIPFGSAVMLQSQADPFPLRMRRWIDRPDAARIARQQAAVEAELLAAARQRPQHRGADKCAARNGCRHHDAEEVGLTLGRQAGSQTSRSGTRRTGCSARVSPLTVASDLSYFVSSVNTSRASKRRLRAALPVEVSTPESTRRVTAELAAWKLTPVSDARSSTVTTGCVSRTVNARSAALPLRDVTATRHRDSRASRSLLSCPASATARRVAVMKTSSHLE